jgi:hypothetical protein
VIEEFEILNIGVDEAEGLNIRVASLFPLRTSEVPLILAHPVSVNVPELKLYVFVAPNDALQINKTIKEN